MKRTDNDHEAERLFACLAAFERDPHMAPMREWLQASQRTAEQSLVHEQDDTRLRQQQGAARELTELNEQIAAARDNLKRLRSR